MKKSGLTIKKMPIKRYKTAVIGCGRIGFAFDKDSKRKYVATHIGAYKSIKRVELAAICDIREDALKECVGADQICKGYTDFHEMLKSEKIDILSICTPPATHYSILKECVKFPIKAVFCEKPLADNVKEAAKMVELCRKAGIILQVGHQRRFDPLHINLRGLIENKMFGEVQQVNFYYTAGIKNTGSHMFDLFRFLFGDVEWIEAFFSKNKSGREDDPNVDGLLKFKNGVIASFQACDVKKYLLFELNCFLDKARFILKDSGFKLDFYKAMDSKYFSGYKELLKARPPFGVNYKRNFMVNGVTHLMECIEKGRESVSSGKDGLEALRLVENSVISAQGNGRRIFLD